MYVYISTYNSFFLFFFFFFTNLIIQIKIYILFNFDLKYFFHSKKKKNK